MNSRFDFRLWGCIFLFWNVYIRSWGEKGWRERVCVCFHSITNIPCVACAVYALSTWGRAKKPRMMLESGKG